MIEKISDFIYALFSKDDEVFFTIFSLGLLLQKWIRRNETHNHYSNYHVKIILTVIYLSLITYIHSTDLNVLHNFYEIVFPSKEYFLQLIISWQKNFRKIKDSYRHCFFSYTLLFFLVTCVAGMGIYSEVCVIASKHIYTYKHVVFVMICLNIFNRSCLWSF